MQETPFLKSEKKGLCKSSVDRDGGPRDSDNLPLMHDNLPGMLATNRASSSPNTVTHRTLCATQQLVSSAFHGNVHQEQKTVWGRCYRGSEIDAPTSEVSTRGGRYLESGLVAKYNGLCANWQKNKTE
eukprot:1196131-Prorocentrum_minimum.AAC.5